MTIAEKQNVDIYAGVEAITNERPDGREYYNWNTNEVYVLPVEFMDADGLTI